MGTSIFTCRAARLFDRVVIAGREHRQGDTFSPVSAADDPRLREEHAPRGSGELDLVVECARAGTQVMIRGPRAAATP
jgi:hypothetical protein